MKGKNLITKLHRREIGSIAKKPLRSKHSEIMFRNFQLQGEVDVYDPNSPCYSNGISYKPRSKIVKFYFAQDIIFAWDANNVCAAFSGFTKKRICFLNRTFDEGVNFLHFDNDTASLMSVSQFTGINIISVHIRATPIDDIRNGRPESGIQVFATQLFHSDILRVDHVHAKAVTYRPRTGIVKVFDLNNSTNTNKMLYSFSDKTIDQVLCIAGLMLITFKNFQSKYLPIQIISTENGIILRSLCYKLRTNYSKVFIHLFLGNVIFKQVNRNIQILNLGNEQMSEMKNTGSMNPSSVYILDKMQSILTVHNGNFCTWNLKGELLRSFEDDVLRGNDVIMCTNADQDLIIYLRPRANGGSSITVRSILTGKCVVEINSNAGMKSNASGSVEEALKDITALSYHYERNEILTGNMQGRIHVWSNYDVSKLSRL